MSNLYPIFVGLLIICSYLDATGIVETPPKTCLRNQFHCRLVNECIPMHLRCDAKTYKVSRCLGGSERRTCEEHRCSEGEHRCGNGWCIPASWVCDGFTHCFDRSDEKGCAPVTDSICLRNQFRCLNGKCIRLLHRCDKRYACSDKSDEKHCPTTFCPEGYHYCPRNETNYITDWYLEPSTERCIPNSHVCNGEIDCFDESDEAECDKCETWGCAHNCNDASDWPKCSCNEGYELDDRDKRSCIKKDRPCLRNQFLCGRKCYSISRRSNDLSCYAVVEERKIQCLDDEHHCDRVMCIPASWVCDGFINCFDGSDEKDCAPVTDPICLRNQFRCGSGECISIRGRCDGFASKLRDDKVKVQCKDLSDEFECPENWCPEGYLRCDKKKDDGTKNCIPKSSFCDGIPDCKDGWDEKDCDKCKNWGCSQFCEETLPWPRCFCKEGYELDVEDKRTCSMIGDT